MKRVENCKGMSIRRITRREFLGRTAALSGIVASPWLIPSSSRGGNGNVAPSERITVGLIGKGLMGSGHLRRLIGDRDVQVLAVCDVDRLRCEDGKRRVEETYAAERSNGMYRGCAAYNDYRELLARTDIDAVVIVTPDHWHALQAIEAAKAGKDIYCEKPISITVRQGRRLFEAVRRYGRVFQRRNPVSFYSDNQTGLRVCPLRRTWKGQTSLHFMEQTGWLLRSTPLQALSTSDGH